MQVSVDSHNIKLNMILGSITILFLALIAIALVLSTRRDLLDTREDYYIVTYYSNIGLLTEGAPIKYGGVNIGRVVSVELLENMRIQVECELITSKKIPTDSKLAVAATTVSGDTYLNLIIGSAPTTLAHSSTLENAPVLKGLNFISISNVGSIFTDMKEVTTVFTSSLTRLFGKDSYTLAQYKETLTEIPKLKENFELLNEEEQHLMKSINKVQAEMKGIKKLINCCMEDLFEKYPINKIKSDMKIISSSFKELSDTLKTLQIKHKFSIIQTDMTKINNWANTLKVEKNSILAILLSKGCGGISKTIEIVNNSIETAQDFSLFKKLGFYLDGKELVENFEKRTHAEYLPSSVYMYRWSVFSYQRYIHNCDLPCGEKNCPSSLR